MKFYLIVKDKRSILPLGQKASSGGMMSVENMNIYIDDLWDEKELLAIAKKHGAELFDVSKLKMYITKLTTGDYHIKFKTVVDIISKDKDEYLVK